MFQSHPGQLRRRDVVDTTHHDDLSVGQQLMQTLACRWLKDRKQQDNLSQVAVVI
jgi:hypothetical protein